MASKTFHDLGMPELYRDIIVDDSASGYRSKRDLALMEHLRHSNQKTSWIRNLSISSMYFKDFYKVIQQFSFIKVTNLAADYLDCSGSDCKVFEARVARMAHERLPKKIDIY